MSSKIERWFWSRLGVEREVLTPNRALSCAAAAAATAEPELALKLCRCRMTKM